MSAPYFPAMPAAASAAWSAAERPGYRGGAHPDFIAAVARMPGLDAKHEAALRTYIGGLIEAGIWSKLDVRVVEAGSEARSLVNIRQNAYHAVNEGMTYTAGQGFAGNGTDAYLDSNFKPGAGARYTLNSAHFMVWSNTAGKNNGHDAYGGALFLKLRVTTDNLQFFLNDATLTSIASTDGSGMFVLNRPSASVKQAWRNGVQMGTDAAVNATFVPARKIQIGGRVGSTFGARQFRAYSIGAGLTPTEIDDDYTLTAAYFSAVA